MWTISSVDSPFRLTMLIGSRSRGKGVVSVAADRKQEVRTESSSSRHGGSQSRVAMVKGGGRTGGVSDDVIRSWWASAERNQESKRSLRVT